eukprot:1557174-Prymnesium_polylepis.2
MPPVRVISWSVTFAESARSRRPLRPPCNVAPSPLLRSSTRALLMCSGRVICSRTPGSRYSSSKYGSAAARAISACSSASVRTTVCPPGYIGGAGGPAGGSGRGGGADGAGDRGGDGGAAGGRGDEGGAGGGMHGGGGAAGGMGGGEGDEGYM